MKTVVMTVIAVLVIWSMFRKAEVDEADLGAQDRAGTGKPVPATSFGRRKQSV